MEWLGATLKPYDLLPKDMGGTADVRTPAKAAAAAAKPAAASSGDSDSMWHVSFDDVLDVVNPLQHLPIVGTVYRALTHDQIKTPEKIAGDTLYGGPMGLVSSVADLAFEKLTGHNFGDTVMALFTGHHDDAKPTAVASTDKPAAPAAATTTAPVQTASANETALAQSLTKSGMDSDMAQRALYAYRRASGAPAQVTASPL